MTLRRLILTIKPDGHELRVLYRTTSGTGPSTKKRRREVADLARSGLEQALEALDAGETEMVGTAGFTTREDRLLATASSDAQKPMRKGA